MQEKFSTLIIALLLAVLAGQSYLLWERTHAPRSPPYFVGLAPEENRGEEEVQHNALAALGPTLNLEILIRGIYLLEQDEALKLTPRQARQVLPLIKQAQATREELRRSFTRISSNRQELLADGSLMAAVLTPRQLALLVRQRNLISVKGFEEPYWEILKNRLEQTGHVR
jgi:hypothetical protein